MNKYLSESELDPENFQNLDWGGEQLRKISIFEALNIDELKEMYSLGEIIIHKPKASIVIEGENTRGFFVLLKGNVSVFKTDQTQTMIRLALLENGAVFGELSLFDNAARSATVIAESTCYLFELALESFNTFLDQKGDNIKTRFYKKCAEEMAERFRKQNDDYISSQQLLWKYALRKEDAQDKKSPN